MMIKDPQQLLLAAEVFKLAKELHAARVRGTQLSDKPWDVLRPWNENIAEESVEMAYRTLIAIGHKIAAMQAEDDGEASMRQIDAMLGKPSPPKG